MEFHFLRVFYPHVKTFGILKYYDFICWRIDCTIDFDRTANNLMACDELNKVARYKMACLYCLENYIRRLWPDVRCDNDLQGITLMNEPLLYYWTFRMDDRCSSMEAEFRNSIEGKLIDGGVLMTWSAMLYMWTISEPETLLYRGLTMLQQKSECWAKNLLCLFTEDQIQIVIQRAGVDVMRELARSSDDVEYVLQMWRYMKNKVTGDDFVSILDEIGKLNSARRRLFFLLDGIWKDAPDYLKNYALEKYIGGIMHLFYGKDRYPLKNLARDMSLFIELLSFNTIEFRNRLWRREWLCLIEGTSAASLNELMKLCFENDQEIANFKKTHFEDYSKIKYYCELLVSKGYFDELDEFLSFCTPDPKIVASLKKKIVWSECFAKYCIDYFDDAMKLYAFQKFATDVYPEPRHRMNLRCQVVSSFWKNGCLRELINGDNIHTVKNLLRLFMTRENDLKKVKKSFKQICLRVLTSGKLKSFSVQEWDDVLLWCLNDNEAQWDQFKRSIPINDVYPILFDKWIKTIENSLSNHPHFEPDDFTNQGIYDYYEISDNSDEDSNSFDDQFLAESTSLGSNGDLANDSFDEEVSQDYDESNEQNRVNAIDRFNLLDNFLIWYFGSKTKVDQFKMMKIKEYKMIPLSNVFASNNQRLIKIVLHWFFNGDVKRIQMFENSLKR